MTTLNKIEARLKETAGDGKYHAPRDIGPPDKPNAEGFDPRTLKAAAKVLLASEEYSKENLARGIKAAEKMIAAWKKEYDSLTGIAKKHWPKAVKTLKDQCIEPEWDRNKSNQLLITESGDLEDLLLDGITWDDNSDMYQKANDFLRQKL